MTLKTPLPGKRAQAEMASASRTRSLMAETPPNAVDAAVLVLLTPVNEGRDRVSLLNWQVLLIRRNCYPGVHSGQIAFPGGKREKDDADLLATACREVYEEVGVECSGFELIGELTSLYVPPSNFCIHPFAALRRSESVLRLDPREVVDCKNVPIAAFNPAASEVLEFSDREGNKNPAPAWRYEDYVIWGATAMILAELYRLVDGEGLARG